MHNSARRTYHNLVLEECLPQCSSSCQGHVSHRCSKITDHRRYIVHLLGWYVRLNEHLAEAFQLLRTTDFLSEQWKLDDVEEFVVKLVGFVQIFLLHLVAHVAVLAVRC
jgi:hypothetical protein